MVFKKKVRRNVKFRKNLKLWMLREPEVKEEFAEGVNNKCDSNRDWYGWKRKLLDVASDVCGYTKGKPSNFDKWWWNKNVDVAVCRKWELCRIWKQGQNEEDSKIYFNAKKDAKRVVYMTMDQKAQEAANKVVNCFELPNKKLGRSEMLLGLVVLKVKMEQTKCGLKENLERAYRKVDEC